MVIILYDSNNLLKIAYHYKTRIDIIYIINNTIIPETISLTILSFYYGGTIIFYLGGLKS